MIKDIDKILLEYEPLILKATKRVPLNVRQEVQQNIRIKIWNHIKSGKVIDDNIEIFLKFMSKNFTKEQQKINNRYKNRFISLDTVVDILVDDVYGTINWKTNEIHACDKNTIIQQPDFIEKLCDTSKDIVEELSQVLTEEERTVVWYLIVTNNFGDNYDSLARQFGYSGKNGSKYMLDKIFGKMKQRASELNINI